MSGRDEIIQALAQLDAAAFEDVVSSAFQQRYGGADPTPSAQPDPGLTPAEYAEWLARRHMASDLAIERVVYLPAGAPDDEIRLLEVNRLLNAGDLDPLEPLDFSPDAGPPLRVFVADITRDQWERVQQAPDSLLPPGWDLKGHRVITRG